MHLDELVIVATKSRYALHGEQEKDNPIWQKIKESHERQQRHLKELQQHIPKEQFIHRNELEQALSEKKYFVFLGGDNHFTYCSQTVAAYLEKYPKTEKYIIGVKLDHHSNGNLLAYDHQSFIEHLPSLQQDRYQVQRWTTIKAQVDGKPIYPGIGDYFIGEYGRPYMSRQEVFLNGKHLFSDKSSGMLIATGTGAGNGSWYDNVHEMMFGSADTLQRGAAAASIILTENKGRHKRRLSPGDELIIHSYNDTQGIIIPDSHSEHQAPFMIGSIANIKINDIALPIITPYDCSR